MWTPSSSWLEQALLLVFLTRRWGGAFPRLGLVVENLMSLYKKISNGPLGPRIKALLMSVNESAGTLLHFSTLQGVGGLLTLLSGKGRQLTH